MRRKENEFILAIMPNNCEQIEFYVKLMDEEEKQEKAILQNWNWPKTFIVIALSCHFSELYSSLILSYCMLLPY